MGTREQMLDLERRLHARLARPARRPTCSAARAIAGFMCEFAPAGVTKWSAIRRLAADWGIADAAICAVGDDVNDIPMIRAAGLGVAMGNALPEVKAAADRIAPTPRRRRPGAGGRVAAGVNGSVFGVRGFLCAVSLALYTVILVEYPYRRTTRVIAEMPECWTRNVNKFSRGKAAACFGGDSVQA